MAPDTKSINMPWPDFVLRRQADEPEIVPYKGKAAVGNWHTAGNQISWQDFTAVTFEPDLQRFGMTHLEETIGKLQTTHGLGSERTGRHLGFDGATCVRRRCFDTRTL